MLAERRGPRSASAPPVRALPSSVMAPVARQERLATEEESVL
jgi:hypothetical protein